MDDLKAGLLGLILSVVGLGSILLFYHHTYHSSPWDREVKRE